MQSLRDRDGELLRQHGIEPGRLDGEDEPAWDARIEGALQERMWEQASKAGPDEDGVIHFPIRYIPERVNPTIMRGSGATLDDAKINALAKVLMRQAVSDL